MSLSRGSVVMNSAGTGIFCRNNHEVQGSGGSVPKRCPTCGIQMKYGHPFLLGVGLGFVVSVLVSGLELRYLSTINYASWGPAALFGAIPLVFVVSGAIGAAIMRREYRNTFGIGSYLVGTGVIVAVFLVGWLLLFLLLSIMACIGDC